MLRSSSVEKFLEDYLNVDEKGKKNRCKNLLEELCGNKFEHICIFGAGHNGKSLYYELAERLITIDCFSDNDSKKWGNLPEDIFCIPPTYLKLEKNNMLVIIAMEAGKDSVIAQMREMGMHNVVTEIEVRDRLKEIPRNTPLGYIDQIDYTSTESNYLIGKFNTLLRDTCRYYEYEIDKLKTEKDKENK